MRSKTLLALFIFIGIFGFTFITIALPVYDSVNAHYEHKNYNQINADELAAFYDTGSDKIYLNKNNKFIEVNESYIADGYYEKSTVTHELCHKNQDKHNRLYASSVPGLILNEIECYVKGYLLIR